MQYNTTGPVNAEEWVPLTDEAQAEKLADVYRRHGLDAPLYEDGVVANPLEELQAYL